MEYKSCQATRDCFFLFFFSDRRKLVLQRNTSRWDMFLNSREAFDRCQWIWFRVFTETCSGRGRGAQSISMKRSCRRAEQAAQAQGTEASRGLPISHCVSTGCLPNQDLQLLMCLKPKTKSIPSFNVTFLKHDFSKECLPTQNKAISLTSSFSSGLLAGFTPLPSVNITKAPLGPLTSF